MAKKRNLRMGMARSSSKTREKELLKVAKRLAKNPMLVLPECSRECKKDPFLKQRKHLEKVSKVVDDQELLKKLSTKGDKLSRAVAGTILLKHAGKVPMLAVFRAPWGEVTYAQRGKSTKEKLVGVQNHDHPIWRLFSILDIVKKKKVHVYSDKKKMVCTGKNPAPSKRFVDWDIKQHPYKLNVGGKVHTCKHLKPGDVDKDSVEGKCYLKINWKSAGRIIAFCDKCAGEKNTIDLLSRYMTGPKMENDFHTEVKYTPVIGTKKTNENLDAWSVNPKDLKNYQKSKLTDKNLISRGKTMFEENITQGIGCSVLSKGVWYGEDTDAFIDSLNPDEVEKTALQAVFSDYEDTMIIDDPSPNKVLSRVWKDYGRMALEAVTNNSEIASELLRDYEADKSNISSLLHEGDKLVKIHAILSKLPEYKNLPRDWEFADSVARTHRTGGKKETVEFIDKYREKSKPLAWAFLKALDASSGRDWMYTEIEMEQGEGIKSYAKNLLTTDGDHYHDSLSTLMGAVGSSGEVQPI